MQEKEKNVSAVKFLRSFGPKITGGEYFNPEDDTTDQRAPVNDPESLYNQFVVPAGLLEELDSETIDDFDNDIYDYEDRTDLGVDIATMNVLEHERKNLKSSSVNKSVEKDKKEKSGEEDEKVISGDNE